MTAWQVPSMTGPAVTKRVVWVCFCLRALRAPSLENLPLAGVVIANSPL